jgi:hypothetical protein
MEKAIERIVPYMISQGEANTIWACGPLGVPPTRRVLDELEAALWHEVIDMFPQEFSNITLGYANFDLRPMPPTLDALKQVAKGHLRKIDSQVVVNTLCYVVLLNVHVFVCCLAKFGKFPANK